jgi:hypothetical protein
MSHFYFLHPTSFFKTGQINSSWLTNLKKHCTLDTQQHLIPRMVQCSSTYLPFNVGFLCAEFCFYISQFFVHSNKQICSSSSFLVPHPAMFHLLPPQIPYPLIKVHLFPSQSVKICSLILLFILSSI